VIRISNDTNLIQQDVLVSFRKRSITLPGAHHGSRRIAQLRRFPKPNCASACRPQPERSGQGRSDPARAIVKFKPGKEMREQVLKLTEKIAAPVSRRRNLSSVET